jgi:hypothetical protein
MNKQRGAVLVIALIFLLLITAIAASLMTSGSFETVMVANKQKRDDLFHVGEAGVEQVLRNDAIFQAADTANGTVNANQLLAALPANSSSTYVAEVEALSLPGVKGAKPKKSGESIDGSAGTSGSYLSYEIRSTASALDNSMATELVLGVARPDNTLIGNGDQ